MSKILKFVKEKLIIILIILVSLILHLLVINEVGFEYSLNSDDASYVQSGITFLKTGTITMHGVLSAQIMPGMTFLIAFISLIFGTGTELYIALKILWMIMGLLTIVVVYKIGNLFTNKVFSAAPCLFLLAIDFIWMDNLILTETPFILLFALLVYHTFKIALNPNKKDYIMIVIYYIMAVFIRPNIGIYPIFLFIYLLIKKYDFKLLIRQCCIAGGILILCLLPWTIRNYNLFGKFIPLTYGTGNPLLLGTYQGVGYPSDEELDYTENVDKKMSSEMRYYLENKEISPYLTKYYSLEYDGMKAKYRMSEWWNNDKISMLKSYLFYKPITNFYNSFYWKEVLGIKSSVLVIIRRVEIILFAISSILIIVDKKRIKELLFVALVYASQIALYSYTFAFERYAISMFFLRYIVIAIGLDSLFDIVKKWRRKDESINNNSSIQRGVKYIKNSK